MVNNQDHIIECPNCGNKTILEIISQVTIDETLVTFEKGQKFPIESYFFITRCRTCNQSAVFTSCDADEFPDRLDMAIQIWPPIRDVDYGIPNPIRLSYLEAKKIKNLSFLGFTVLIRRALEQVCLDKKAQGLSLKKKIEDLATKEIIPSKLAEMADLIRVLGNMGAHESNFDLTKRDIYELDDFFLAVIEYVYVAPERIKQLRNRVNNSQQNP